MQVMKSAEAVVSYKLYTQKWKWGLEGEKTGPGGTERKEWALLPIKEQISRISRGSIKSFHSKLYNCNNY